jgi:hypothetical protein
VDRAVEPMSGWWVAASQQPHHHTAKLRLGSAPLEEALQGFSFIEFYGEWSTVLDYLHYTLSANTNTRLIYVQLFGGINPYTLTHTDTNLIVRCFDHNTLLEAFNRVNQDSQTEYTLLVANPYLHAETPRQQTEITAHLRSLAQKRRVVTFNQETKTHTPKGGYFHASSVHILIHLETQRRRGGKVGVGVGGRDTVYATLTKHPAQPNNKHYTLHLDKNPQYNNPKTPTLLNWLQPTQA